MRKILDTTNIDNSSLELVVPGSSYDNPIIWENSLIFQNMENEVFISDLDGSNKKLLFKNKFLHGALSISPDNSYLACQSRYDVEYIRKLKNNQTEDLIPICELLPGSSLFIMNLSDNTYTYIPAEEKEFPYYFSWYLD